jgi:POT family proton-dependent oligopeptide transporter
LGIFILVSDPWRGGFHDEPAVNKFIVTAPPTGNVITSVLGALRRRRESCHDKTIQPEREGQSSNQEGGAVTTSEDETLLRETKAALKACLLL